MTRKINILLCAALSLMFCFLTVGYATVSDTLSIRGQAKIEIPAGLFITNIEVAKASGVDVNNFSFTPYSTTVDTGISKSSNSTAGSVTYRITVLNNTSRVYAFRKLYYQTSVSDYDNDKIQTSNGSRAIGVVVDFPKDSTGKNKTIGVGEELTFEVTYTVGSNRSTFPANKTAKTLINYQFGINVDSEEEAVEAIHEKFLNILNTTSTYNTLVDVLDNKFDGAQEWTSNYVGNVGDATSDDALTVNTLFAGQLEMIINGETKPATVIIKHENLDNNRGTGDDYVAEANGGRFEGYGCEMTLYLTTHSLKRSDSSNGYAQVYVTVFTCDRDANGNIVSDWYKIGDIYEGQANIVGYKGEANGEGSFVTDNWIAYDKTYNVTDDYFYNVSAGTTIKTLAQVVDEQMISEFQSLISEAKAIIEDTRYAGTGIEAVEDIYGRASRYYTIDAYGEPIADRNTTRAQLCPIVRELEAGINTVKDKINQTAGLD